MAIARSTTLGGNNGTTGSVTTGSITNFTISGSDKVLYVVTESNDTPVVSPTASWSGNGTPQGMTQIAVSTGTGTALNLFRLINPTDETNGTISFTGLSGSVRDSFIGVLVTGVDQTTPNGTVDVVEVASGGPGTVSSNTITCAAGNWILGFASDQGIGNPPTCNGAAVVLESETGGANGRCCYHEDTDGADDTMDWDFSATNGAETLLTFELKAAGTGGATGKPRLWRMGTTGVQ